MFVNETASQQLGSQEKGEPMKYNGHKLTKRKDGRWQYRITVNKKRVCIYGKTQLDCIANIKRFEKHDIKKIKTKSVTVDIINNWYSTIKEPNIREKSKTVYNNTLNNYIIPFLKDKDINKIKLHELQEFINNIDKERVREQIYQHVKSIFKYATASGELKTNIAEAIILPKRKNIQKRESLTIEEQKQLLTIIKDSPIEPFIMFSIIFGSRRNETMKFNLEDINIEKQTLHIKGTKTESAERTIKISKDMIEYLYSHKKTEPYFNHQEKYYTDEVKKVLEQINPNLCLHCLRHTCATNLFYLGVPDKIRQQILGHKSIVTTNNIYTNLELDVGKNDVLKLYNNLYYSF